MTAASRRGNRQRVGRRLRHWFKPTKENGRHPQLLRREVVLGILALALAAEVICVSQILFLSRLPAMTAAVLPAAITSLTNLQRSNAGLPALETNAALTEAAQDAANDMAAKGYFAHVAPDGTTPWDWLRQVGYDYQYAGENLAMNFTDSTDVVTAWMNSPLHRANILKGAYAQIGVGIADGVYQGHQTTFVVEFFGAPAESANSAAAGEPRPETASPGAAVATAARATSTLPGTAFSNGAVLGAQTAAPVPTNPSLYQKVAASPRRAIDDVVFAFVAVVLLLLVLAYLPPSRYLPHPAMLFNGGALVAVLLGLLMINRVAFGAVIVMPADGQSAAAAMAVSR